MYKHTINILVHEDNAADIVKRLENNIKEQIYLKHVISDKDKLKLTIVCKSEQYLVLYGLRYVIKELKVEHTIEYSSNDMDVTANVQFTHEENDPNIREVYNLKTKKENLHSDRTFPLGTYFMRAYFENKEKSNSNDQA